MDLKVAPVTTVPLAHPDLRAAPVSLVSKDNWAMLASLGSRVRLDQKENRVPKVLRVCSDLRVKKESEVREETPGHWDQLDRSERGELLVTEGSLELMDCQDQREPKETVVSLVLMVLKALSETRVALESPDFLERGV